MAILRYIIYIGNYIMMATLLVGCYEDINLEIDAQPVLCLNSLITAGEPIEVKVTHTWMFNDEKSERYHDVADACVYIYANDKPVDDSYIPAEGDKIRIEAYSQTYGPAMAEVTVPYASPICKVMFRPMVTDVWKENEDFFHYEMLADISFNINVEMAIIDPAGCDNYYKFDYGYYYGEQGDDTLYKASGPLFTSLYIGRLECDMEPIFKEHVGVFETAMGNGEYIDFMFFTDRQFSGRTYTLHLNFSDNYYSVKSEEYDESLLDCGICLYLSTVSQSYYNWAVYKWNVDEGIVSEMSDIGLADPWWGYSNVSTGAGVVAAQTYSMYEISLKDFIKEILESDDKAGSF